MADFYTLKNVPMVMNSKRVYDLNKLSIEWGLEMGNRRAGASYGSQSIISSDEAPKISATCMNGANVHFRDFVPGTIIEDFELNPDDDDQLSFLNSGFFEAYPLPWCIGKVSTDIEGKDNSEFSFDIHVDVLNPGSIVDKIIAQREANV